MSGPWCDVLAIDFVGEMRGMLGGDALCVVGQVGF